MVKKIQLAVAEIVTEVNQRGLDKGFDDAKKKTTKKLNQLQKITKAAGAKIAGILSPANLGIAGIAALASLPVILAAITKRAISTANAIGKTADKIGVTTTELQELRFGAERSGVATTALDMGLQRFARRVAEAAEGTGELQGILKQYEIDVTNADGSSRKMTDVLDDFADAIQGAASDGEKLRLAFKGFDSEGAALVNLFREGSIGLQQFRTRAHELGLVIEDDLIRQAERANDALTDLSAAIRTNLDRAVLQNVGLLTEWAGSFDVIIKKVQVFFNALTIRKILSLSDDLDTITDDLGALDKQIRELTKSRDALASKTDISDLVSGVESKELKELNNVMRLLAESEAKRNALEIESIAITERLAVLTGENTDKTKDNKDAVEEYSASVDKMIFNLSDQAALLAFTGEALDDLKLKMAKETLVEKARQLAIKEGKPFQEEQKKEIELLAEDIHNLTKVKKENAAATAEQTKAEAQYAAELASVLELIKTDSEEIKEFTAQLDAFIEKGDLDLEQKERALEEFLKRFEKVKDEAKDLDELEVIFDRLENDIDRLATSFSQAFTDILTGGKSTFRELGLAIVKEMLDANIKTLSLPLFQALGRFGISLFSGSPGPAIGGGRTGSGVPFPSGAFDSPLKFAGGGRIGGGQLGIVGEAGPELFVPSSSGVIIPNDGVGLGGGVEVNIFNSSGTDAEVTRTQQSNGLETIDIVIRKVAQDILSMGPAGQAVAHRFSASPSARGRG